jgi:hypothetical protein
LEFYHIIARILSVVFMLGVAGCLITIPIVAVRFAMVLFERESEESPEQTGEEAPAKS